ncbi:MAG: O-antigen ligase family protein [Tetrasphaera sp.]
MSAALDAGLAAAGARPVARGRRALDTGGLGAALGLCWVVAACVATLGGAARLMLVGFPLGAALIALGLLALRRWNAYLAFAIVMWLTTNEVRRFVDWKSVYHEQNPILLTATVVSILSLPWGLLYRRRVRKEIYNLVSVVMAVGAYGLLVGIVRNGFLPAIADSLYLLGPLSLGLFVLKVMTDDEALRRVLRGTAVWGCLGLGAYGLIQFLVLPPWDLAWMLGSEISSIGAPRPGEFRTFSTLTTTGPLGQVLAALLLILVSERRVPRQFIAAAVGMVCLGTTLVRAGWIGLALGMVLLFVLGRTKILRMGAVLAALLAGLIVLGGPIIGRMAERANNTTSQTTEDISLQKRIEFQTRIAPTVLSDPIGLGFGATGRVSNLNASDFTDPHFRNFDSGIFETLARFGVIAGLLYLGAIITATAKAVRRARRTELTDTCLAAAALALTFGIIFTDTSQAIYGMVLWLCLATLGRVPQSGGRA